MHIVSDLYIRAMNKNLLSVTALLCALAMASAQENGKTDPTLQGTTTATTENIRSLSLTDCVQIGLEHNLDIKINRFQPMLSKYDYSMAYGAYDPTLTVGYTHSDSKNPSSTETGTTYITTNSEIYNDNATAGLNFLTPLGSTVGVQGTYSRSGYSPGVYNRDESQFNGSGRITITQPLLKNMWIDSSRMNIRVARNTMHSSELTYQYNLMTTINQIELAYFNLIGAREDVVAAEQNLNQSEEFLKETLKKVELGSLIELDSKDAESQVASSKSSLIGLKQAYKTAANNLRRVLSDDFSQWQDVDFNLTDELTTIASLPSRADSWYKGLTLRPDLLQMKVDLENKDINIKYSFNQLFPQLDVIGSYGHAGAGWADGESPLTQVAQGTYPNYSIGGQLSVPIGTITARNTYKRRKAEREQSILLLKQKEQNVMVEIDNAINSVNSSLEAITSTREARQYAEQAYEAGKVRLEHGKATSFEVLQLQTTLFQNKLAEIKALVNYNINLATLRYTEGITLENYNIEVIYE